MVSPIVKTNFRSVSQEIERLSPLFLAGPPWIEHGPKDFQSSVRTLYTTDPYN